MAGNDSHIVDGSVSNKAGQHAHVTDGEVHVRAASTPGSVIDINIAEVTGIPIVPAVGLVPITGIVSVSGLVTVSVAGDATVVSDSQPVGAVSTNRLRPGGFERLAQLVTLPAGIDDNEWSYARVDEYGAQWVRIAEVINILSSSTDGRPIPVVAVATPGTAIHTVGAAAELVWLYATNTTAAEITVTIEFGGAAAGDQIELKIPADDTRPIVTGQPLQNTLAIAAFASAVGINISGYTKNAP